MKKVYYWYSVMPKPSYSKLIEKLLYGDYQELDLKKLKGYEIYSAYMDGNKRLLFTTFDHETESCLLLLEIEFNNDIYSTRVFGKRFLFHSGAYSNEPVFEETSIVEFLQTEKAPLEITDSDIEFVPWGDKLGLNELIVHYPKALTMRIQENVLILIDIIAQLSNMEPAILLNFTSYLATLSIDELGLKRQAGQNYKISILYLLFCSKTGVKILDELLILNPQLGVYASSFDFDERPSNSRFTMLFYLSISSSGRKILKNLLTNDTVNCKNKALVERITLLESINDTGFYKQFLLCLDESGTGILQDHFDKILKIKPNDLKVQALLKIHVLENNERAVSKLLDFVEILAYFPGWKKIVETSDLPDTIKQRFYQAEAARSECRVWAHLARTCKRNRHMITRGDLSSFIVGATNLAQLSIFALASDRSNSHPEALNQYRDNTLVQ